MKYGKIHERLKVSRQRPTSVMRRPDLKIPTLVKWLMCKKYSVNNDNCGSEEYVVVMIGLMNSCKNLNIFFNVDDIIITSLIKVLSELKTLYVLMHFYPNLAQLIVCRIWCWLWTTTQILETFLNLLETICPSYMNLHA